ncbi:Wzz/FepE/Etk N-terminal domain-containing protein [Microlunatus endophyticus]
MTLTEFLGTLRRRWVYLVVAVVLGCALGTASFAFATPMYRSSATVYFSVPQATSGGDLAQGATTPRPS